MFHIGYIHTCGLLLPTGEGHHHRILRLRWVGLRPPGCRPSQLQGTEEEIQEIQGVRPEIHKETSTWQKLGLQAFFGPKWCHSLKLTPETTSQQLISYSNNLAKYGAPPWGAGVENMGGFLLANKNHKWKRYDGKMEML